MKLFNNIITAAAVIILVVCIIFIIIDEVKLPFIINRIAMILIIGSGIARKKIINRDEKMQAWKKDIDNLGYGKTLEKK